MEQILSYKIHFFNIVTTISFAFSPVINNSLHATLTKICTSGGDTLLHNVSRPTTSLFGLRECKHQWMSMGAFFFPHGGIQWHIFASHVLSCQVPFCKTALLLLSVVQKQSVMEYWQENSASTAIPAISTSDIMAQ